MNIAVCAGNLIGAVRENNAIFFSEILLQLARQKKEHNFFLITTQSADIFFSASSNLEIIDPGFPGRSSLLKKSWQRFKLPGLLRKIKADVLISFDGQFSSFLSIPQVPVLFEGEKVHPGSLQKARVIVCVSQEQRNELVKKYRISKEKISVIPIAINEIYKPVGEEERENIKARFSEGKEYFLYPENQFKAIKLMNVLKSFSHFKKRQRSNMKLVILANPDKKFLHTLSAYKYRNDIRIINEINEAEAAALSASAYAVIINSEDHQSGFSVLKALQSGVPVIVSKNTLSEFADEAVLQVDKITETGIGEKMIQIYTDEKLRSRLIQNGKKISGQYSFLKTGEFVWNCIIKAVK